MMPARWRAIPQGWLPLARRLAKALAGIALVAVLAEASEARSDDALKINVGSFQNPNLNIWAPLVAQEAGFYAKYGLDATVKQVKGGNIIPLVLTGGLDVGCSGGPVIDALIQGQPLLIVFGEGAILPYTLVSRTALTSVEALKGARLSTPQVGSGTSYLVISETLKRHGIEPHDVQWIELADAPTRARALIAGRIDATVLTQDETLLVAGRPEVRALVENPGESTEIKPFMYCFVTRAYAAAHDEALKRWATAMLATHRMLDADKTAYVALAAKIKSDQITAEEAGRLFDLAHSTGYWSLNGGIDPAWYERTMAYFLTTSENPKVQPKLKDYLAERYVRAALDRLGRVPSRTDPAAWYQP
jgi:ABC-type nitrate/sulfonate/bicarbonate transport system substrate-binding protein